MLNQIHVIKITFGELDVLYKWLEKNLKERTPATRR
nr:MAG TPA: Interleukin-19, interleukin, four helix bundle [Caudoviricetes sp.]